MDKKTIRSAITKNRGGLQDASDEQHRTIWDALMPDTQKEYLNSINSATEGTENTKKSATESTEDTEKKNKNL